MKSEKRATVDVAAALQALKTEVRRQRHELRGAGALAVDAWHDAVALEEIQARARVNPHLPIAWPTWPPGVLPKVVALLQKVTRRLLRWYINPIVEQQNEFNAAVAQALSDLVVEMRAEDTRLRHLVQAMEQALHEEHLRHQEQEQAQARQSEVLAQRLWRLEQQLVRPTASPPTREPAAVSSSAGPPESPVLDIDYYRFELCHRGSPEEIRARQEFYLPYFQGCRHVLDIGCGRGEFIALLRAQGIEATGVDIDAQMVAHCQAEGLPVIQADALAYLEDLPDGKLDGIFMAQVVEHLTPAHLVQLLRVCYQKLAAGGVLIAETINPTCVFALVHHYLMDPSHRQPLHPATLRFMLEDAGFWQVEVEYLAPVAPDQRLVPLPADGLSPAQQEAFNRNIERLNALLYGYQDYAVIARRPPDDLSASETA